MQEHRKHIHLFSAISPSIYWWNDSVIEALLLLGMGVTLTEEEDAQLEPIRKPGFIALALADDYLSFDREYLEFSESG